MELQLNDENPVKIAIRERKDKSLVEESVITKVEDNENVVIVGDKPFHFDYILNESQEELFLNLGKPLVDKVILGFNTTCLAYGQTGTGKTYSMGLNDFNYNDRDNFGIIPRSLEELFDKINNENILNSIMVSLSYVEIYNEKVYDMFAEKNSEQINVKGCRFVGGVKKEISSLDDAFALLRKGNRIRHVRPTKLNGSSSRSHAVFTIHLTKSSTSSCLNLVDLAGSEGIRRTGHEGIAREEGVNINQGLLSIGKVLQAIISKSAVIPYRDSVLTTVLQSSLNCESYFTLLACVSPLKEDLSESLATLRFAQNAKRLKIDPKLNKLMCSLKKKQSLNTCFRRASNLQSIKKIPFKSNTFSTPNKNPLQIRKLNISESTVKKRNGNNCNYVLPSKQNDSLDGRDSLISFNMSTSTALDVPVTQSYSPIVKKCILEYESKMREDLKTFYESIISKENKSKYNNSNVGKTPQSSTPVQATNKLQWNEIRSEIKDIVRKEMTAITIQNTQNDLTNLNDYEAFHSEMYNSDDSINSSDKTLHQTIDRAINRKNRISPRLQSINLRRSVRLTTIAAEADVIDVPKNLRRSVRLNSMACINDFSSTIRPKNLRRSVRLNSMASINDFSSTLRPKNLRRSVRLSNVNINQDSSTFQKPKNLRRSIRIQSNIVEESADIINMKHKLNNINKPLQKTNNLYEKNLLTTTNSNSSHSLKKQHKDNILKLLNTGSLKELNILPQVGTKTAYQIVTYRTLNGKFKSFEHISGLPFWRGSAYERFKNANHID